MEKEEIARKKNIIRNYRDDNLLTRVIDEFSSRFKGQITRGEVLKRLIDNKFVGFYVLSDEDYVKVNEDEGKNISSAGSYVPALKCITLRRKFSENNISIGCHELTHALIDGMLSYTVKYGNQEVSYGLGFEEGVSTTVEKMKGKAKVRVDNGTYHFGYSKNYLVMSELNILYQNSKYKRYDNIIIEAIKQPKDFFNLIYRIILDCIKGIYEKAKDVDTSMEDIKTVALKCSFLMLQSTDMLVEFNDPESSKVNQNIALRSYGYARFINGCLLSYIDKNIRNGIISPEYIGPFYKDDFKLLQLMDEDRLIMAIFASEAPYFKKMITYIDKILTEYTLGVERLEKETEQQLVFKSK